MIAEHIEEPFDFNMWKRQKEANTLGIPVEELADEPDNEAGDPEQAGF